MQISELREIVAQYQDQEERILEELGDTGIALRNQKDEIDKQGSMIKGLSRRLDAVNADKIAVLVFSPTGHHKVRLAGPWVRGDYGAMLLPFKRAIRLQEPESKNKAAVARSRARLAKELEDEVMLRNMTVDERLAYDEKIKGEDAAAHEVLREFGLESELRPNGTGPLPEAVDEAPTYEPKFNGDVDIVMPADSGMADSGMADSGMADSGMADSGMADISTIGFNSGDEFTKESDKEIVVNPVVDELLTKETRNA